MSHITRLQAENFKRIVALDIRPGTSAGIVPIRGRNAQGKSSTLDAIMAALGGKSVMPSRPVRAGEEDGAIRIELDDGVVILRRFSADGKGDSIEVVNGEGFKASSPQRLLDSLYASVAFDPLAFTRLDALKQFEVLRSLVKLDTDIDALAAANKADYAERTVVNREVKERAAQLPQARPQGIIPKALVDEDALSTRIGEAGDHNVMIERRKANREEFAAAIQRNRDSAARERDRIAELEERLLAHRENLNAFDAQVIADEKQLAGAEPLPEPIDVTALASDLRAAREGNRLVHAQAQYVALEASLEQRRKDAETLTKRMEERDEQRAAAIARAEMPVPGLSFGDGMVLFGGIPLEQASSAEQLRVSTAIGMASAPKLRVMLVRDGSLLDDEGQTILAELAETNGFQLWVEAVDASGKVGIVLEGGEVTAINGEQPPAPEPIKAKRKTNRTASAGDGEPDEGGSAGGQGEEVSPPAASSPDQVDELERADDGPDGIEQEPTRAPAPVSLFD